MKNVDSYLDSLLSEFTNPKTLNKAKLLVSTKSQKVFDDLDSKNLQISNQQVHLDIEFRSQSAKLPLPTRKIDCFGRSEERILTNEEIQSLRKERAQRAQLKLKQLQEASENRKQELIKAWKITQELKNHKPLFQLIKEQEQEHLKQQQEDFQKKLEKIRLERKPLTKKDFEEHRKNFCDIVIKPRNHSVDLTQQLQSEKSRYYMMVEQEQNKFMLLEKERKCKQQELLQKKKQFSEQIKNQFKPKMSLEKKEELQELQNKLTHKPDFKQYQMLANKVRAKKVLYQLQDTDEETSSLINCLKSKDQNTSYDLASQDTQMPKLKHKSFAYDNTFQTSINHWQKVALSSKISYNEKNQLIIDQAKKLEQMSQKQEQLARVQGQESIEADNLLISSIKAKLTVLEN